MKVINYPKVTELATTDIFLIDGDRGTKSILAGDVMAALLAMLEPEDFIGYIDMTAINKVTTLESANLIMVYDGTDNKAIVAGDAAAALLTLLKQKDFTEKLSPSSITPTTNVASADRFLVEQVAGEDKGMKSITGTNAAKAILKLMDKDEMDKKLGLTDSITEITEKEFLDHYDLDNASTVITEDKDNGDKIVQTTSTGVITTTFDADENGNDAIHTVIVPTEGDYNYAKNTIIEETETGSTITTTYAKVEKE